VVKVQKPSLDGGRRNGNSACR